MSTATVDWKIGRIEGCAIRPLKTFEDERGWLAEFFRIDELPDALHPEMGYLSLTHAGVARGPHEHVDQTDLFLFFNGSYVVYLWDDREDSETYGCKMREEVGAERPSVVIVPPGVVHAYKNVGTESAFIVNCPNRLYAGRGKSEPVDEIRHEELDDSPFVLD